MTSRSDPSWTEAHPVADRLECVPCKVTVSAVSLLPDLVEMWNAKHADCATEG